MATTVKKIKENEGAFLKSHKFEEFEEENEKDPTGNLTESVVRITSDPTDKVQYRSMPT